MSMPKFPSNEPPLSREDVINQIISSIAMEELGLSHIINAEGEKLQYALGTIEGVTGPEGPLTIDELLKLNDSVHKTLDSTMMNQFMLKDKLQNALSASIMQGPTGPRGPMGPVSIEVDPVVNTLNPNEPASVTNTGTPEDLFLKFSIPRGATGATGAVGTILASYNTVDELEKAHPTGNQGDAYLVGGVLYVWNTDTKKWESTGDLRGPTGAVGTILATLKDIEELETKHPEGNQGDTYLVGNGDLYVWNVDAEKWEQVGNLQGPTGPAWVPEQHLFSLSGTTGTGDVGYEGSLDFASDTLTISIEEGSTVKIENPAIPAGGMIPFATGRYDVDMLSAKNGAATNVIFAGFGASSTAVSVTASGFTLPGGNGYFVPFTLSHDVKIKSIYFTTANWAAFDPGNGISVFPYIILAKAAQGENNFTFIEETKTKVSAPWIGGSQIPQNSSRYGATVDIDPAMPTLSAGTRLVICCAFDMEGGEPPLIPGGFWFYYSGSVYYELE